MCGCQSVFDGCAECRDACLGQFKGCRTENYFCDPGHAAHVVHQAIQNGFDPRAGHFKLVMGSHAIALRQVPFSADAVALVKPLLDASSSEFVFPGQNKNKPISDMAMLDFLKRRKRNDLTVHGFRSTFKDWARETTHYPNEVSEAALAHVIGDQTEAAYARGDLFNKRSSLMQDWANYLAGSKAA